MSVFNPKVDEYIAKSADFAKPVLAYLRTLIHDNCPAVEESIKWGYPHFEYKGDVMFILGAFKQHLSFSVYKAALMKDKKLAESVAAGQKMGYMNKIKSIGELPSEKVLTGYIKETMALNEKGLKMSKPEKMPRQ